MSHRTGSNSATTSRRTFLMTGSLTMFASYSGVHSIDAKSLVDHSLNQDQKPVVRVGLITDLHYADKKPAGSRHYRETIDKLAVATAQFKKDEPDMVVELGDLIDSADDLKNEKSHLERINDEFKKLPGKKYYVLGNHCVQQLNKKEFLEGVEQKQSFFSFDKNGIHFVILDSCFRSDGKAYERKNFDWTDPNIPKKQVEWLKEDLKTTKNKTVVFAHQRLDVENHYGVKNAKEIRQVLEQSKKVLAVFQGHSHANDYKNVGGIHYCTLVAMVEGSGKENNAFSTLDIFKNGDLVLHGFIKQKKYDWLKQSNKKLP